MDNKHRAQLVELGLSPTEARVYLVLLQSPGLSASAIASASGLSRTAVYQILCTLSDKGLVESGTGYGSKFALVAPQQALPALIAQEEQAVAQRKKVAETLSQTLGTLAGSVEPGAEEMIEVLRDPRSVLERFKRLQLDAEKTVDAFTKPPYFDPGGNQPESEALRRGVRVRAIYEKAGVDNPGIKPFFHKWITAGEEARIYDGELPHKMVIFDQKVVLMPLFTPGEQMRGVLIRNAQLAECLSLAFQFIWDKSEPLVLGQAKPNETIVGSQQSSSWSGRRNGHARLRRKKTPND
jgi:HTH-type transcriptional regulator, sugar sensing transcriptional regulator